MPVEREGDASMLTCRRAVAKPGTPGQNYPMPQDVLADHLTFLYGPAVAGPVEDRLRQLLRAHLPERPRSAAETRRRVLPLTQRDSLLITYGDQVHEPDEAPLHTLGEFLEEHAAGAVSGVHVLPFYPSSSDDGFSVIDYRTVDPALGTWDDVCRLGRRFDLMFDAVFNHVSARSEWFQGFLRDDPRYRGWFVTVDGDPDLSAVVRPRALPLLTPFETATGVKKVWTTFSADQVDVNAHDPDLLLALVYTLLFYVARGARFIRLDAIAYLWKETGTPCIHLPQTHRAVQLMRSILDEVAPEVLLITETNVPHRDNVSYFGDGTNEAQLVYNFALPPLVLHSVATASAAALSRWAGALELPSKQVTFFNFLASHDGIGVNPVRGILTDEEIDALVRRAPAHGGYVSYKQNPDGSKSPYELNVNYFDALSDPAADEPDETRIRRFLVAHAIMLAMPGMPGIYFHSLFGSRGDREGAESSGIPRRINRQKLGRVELERELADPSSRRARVLFALKALLRQRQASAVFHPAGGWEVVATDPRVFALRRTSPDGTEAVLCLHNVSPDTVRTEGRVLEPYQVLWSPER
jgi:glucosylglycerate phosphorylase